jgi:hypothetical protein
MCLTLPLLPASSGVGSAADRPRWSVTVKREPETPARGRYQTRNTRRKLAGANEALGWLERPTRYISAAVRPRYNALGRGAERVIWRKNVPRRYTCRRPRASVCRLCCLQVLPARTARSNARAASLAKNREKVLRPRRSWGARR